MIIAGPPRSPVEIPRAVARIARDLPVRAIWQNEYGGLTFEVGAPDGFFVKWTPKGSGQDLGPEAARMAWAGAFTTVPRVLDHGFDEHGSWLVTTRIPGESAVSERWRHRPDSAVRAIGRGLRAFHDVLPLYACPFSWTFAVRFAGARR
ncbi:MAG: aminoglycoside 3'-phosphotransferase, partial [Actinobacteria bacterium]|nr:aminoglycoside 3'-phosphotransferase [Actinomycetota bacterium]